MPHHTYKHRREMYTLTQREKSLERSELTFQRKINDLRYMTWLQVLKKVSPEGRYEISDGYIKTVSKGRELLETLHRRVTNQSCTFVISVEEVPPDYEPDPQDLWTTYTHPETGKTIVDNLHYDPWDLTFFSEETEVLDELKYELLSDQDGDNITNHLIEHRSKERRCTDKDALLRARPIMKQTLLNSYASLYMTGSSHNVCMEMSALKAVEAFDRAYGLARIEKAGINLEQHPELRSYQYFFELGIAPPTHEEMADHIIENFNPSPGHADSTTE